MLAKDLKEIAKELNNDDLKISGSIDYSDFGNTEQATEIFKAFENPAPKVLEFIKELEAEIALVTAYKLMKTLTTKPE